MKKLLPAALILAFSIFPVINNAQCPVDSIPDMKSYDSATTSQCYIDEVQVNSVVYSSASGFSINPAGYQNFPTPVIPMVTNQTYNFSLNGFHTAQNYAIIAWLDMNADSLFDYTEAIYSSTYLASSNALFQVTIPVTTVLDTITLRIMKVQDPSLWVFDAYSCCGVNPAAIGETEDYRVSVSCSMSGIVSYDPVHDICYDTPNSLWANPAAGWIEWYTDTLGTPSIITGDYLNYTNPLNADTVFYFKNFETYCESPWYSISINMIAPPAVTISGPDTVYSCSAQTFTGSAGLDWYSWNNGDVSQTTTIGTGFGGYLILSGGDNTTGCFTFDTVWTAIAPLPPSSYTHTNILGACVNPTIQLLYDSIISPGTCTWYEQPSGNLIGSGSFLIYNPASPTGTYNFMACINSMCGLDTAYLSVTLAVPAVDTMYALNSYLDTNGITVICLNGSNFTLVANPVNGTVTEWILGSYQPPMQIILSGGNSINLPSGYLTAGNIYYAISKASNLYGCDAFSDTLFFTSANTYNLNFPTTAKVCSFPTSYGINVSYATYNLLWNTGDTTTYINVPAPGMYSLTLINETNGCVATDSVNIVLANVDFDIFPDTSFICNPPAFFISHNQEVTPYAWTETDASFNIANTGSGIDYYAINGNGYLIVQMNDIFGCGSSVDTTYFDTGIFTVDLGPDTTTSASSYTLTGPPGCNSYEWFPNGETTQSITVNSSGTYTLQIMDNGFGCSGSDNIIVTFLTTGVTSESLNDIQVFPNPANENVYIKNSGKIEMLMIYDVQGKLVTSENGSGKSELFIDTKKLDNGLYFIKILAGKNTSNSKIVVQH